MVAEPIADVAAEQAILAAVLCDNDALDEVSDVFRPGLFGVAAHQRVAEAMIALRASGRPIDPVTAENWLRERGHIPSPVRPELTVELQAAVGTIGNVRWYAEQLAERAAERAYLAALRRAIEDRGPIAERIDRHAKAISGIELSEDHRCRTLGEMASEALESLEKQAVAAREGKPSETLLPTGYHRLDALIGGLRPGFPVVFAGRPSSGKSALASGLVDHFAVRGVPLGMFWLEDSGVVLGKRVLQRRSGVASTLMRDGAKLQPAHWDALVSAAGEIYNAPTLVDDTHALTAAQMAARMRRMAREHRAKVFMVDHLGEVRLDRGSSWDRHEVAIGEALRTLRDTAGELGAALVVFAQLGRDADKRGRDDAPQMRELAGSGEIEKVARVIGFVSREECAFRVHVVKNSDGPTGIVNLGWQSETMAVVNPKSPAEVNGE